MRNLRPVFAAIVVVLVVSACGKALVKPDRSAGAAAQSGAIAAPSISAAPSGSGSCQIKFAGDVTQTWTGTQDASSVTTSYWMTDDAKKAAGLAADDASVSLTCRNSDTNLVSIMTPSGTKAADFIEGAKSYPFPSLGLLGILTSGQMSIVINLNDQALWSVAEAGKFEITAFSSGKISATFSVKLGKLATDLKSYTATTTLTGSFDLNCIPGAAIVCK